MRTGRGRRVGAARCAGACPWRSCASGVQGMAQLAAGGRRGSRGRCGKRVVRGGTRERRRGPPRRPLATCFRAVGNELQAAVQCECRAVGGAASPWLDAGRVHWRLQGGVQSRHTQRDARMGTRCPDGVHASREGWVCGAGWAMRQLRGCVFGYGVGVARRKNACRARAVAVVAPPRTPRPRARMGQMRKFDAGVP